MFRIIKKILKYSLLTLLVLVLILCGTTAYLIYSADMCQPEINESIPNDSLIYEENFRQWGQNYMRHSESGLWEMKLKGSDFQRGVAFGKLASDLLYYQEKVFVDQIKQIVPSENYLRFLGGFTLIFNRNLGKHIPEEFRREIYGVSLSCSDEFNYISTPYERQLNYHAAHDLGHAMQDYMLVGCSSFASWGSDSADSTLIIGRNFDFYVGDAFAKNKIVAFYEPDKGYKFASVTWAGMTGVLSGMNEAGLTVTINAAKSDMPTSAKTPISILAREILQYASTIDEAYKIAQSRETFVAETLFIGSAKDKKVAIIEKSPNKIDILIPANNQESLICTNHYQSNTYANDERNVENIKTSDSKYRYDRLEQLLEQNEPLDATKSASILRNRFGIDNTDVGLTNEMAINQFIAHHSVIFKPEKGIMYVSTSPWQIGKYVAYDLNKIFNDSIDFRNEIYSADLTIAEDSLMNTDTYNQLIQYKDLTKYIKQKTTDKHKISADTLLLFEKSNPEYYHMYELLGDYYKSQNESLSANKQWQKAITKAIPKKSEKDRILKKLEK